MILVCAAAAAEAQTDAATDDDVRGTLRIEVTGSHIVRSDIETALPVQVITRDDIARGGFTTTAALMATVSANFGAFGDVQSVGSQIDPFPRPGLSSVNLRGLGDGSTLVLINGRRVANYAFDGGTVDVNAIPVSAIDRVEILKDGASAIYGSDAIGGVVNFILRKDYRGADVSAQGNWTQHGGGDERMATASVGYGDLDKDRVNAFVTLNYQQDSVLRPTDRDSLSTGFRSDVPASAQTFTQWTFPANVLTPSGDLLNPAYAAGCTPPASRPAPIAGTHFCGYDAQRDFDLLPQVERMSAFGRATFKATPDVQIFAEAAYSQNRLRLSLPPTAAGGIPPDLFFYPAAGPYFPTAFANANGLEGDLNLLLRTAALGPRVDDVETQATRLLLGAQGASRGWDFNTALVYSDNRQSDDFVHGYVSSSRLSAALATGLVNPFGPSGPQGDALLQGTTVGGPFHDAEGRTWLVDARASRDLVALGDRFVALALGAEARIEELDNSFSTLANSGDVLDAGGDHHSAAHSRSAEALYAELDVPFTAALESQFAVRYDHYGDFGGTVNPKVALRWQPLHSLLFRASWGTGFRAPTLYDLWTPQQHTFTAPEVPDPLRCPTTAAASDCVGEFPAVVGGNPALQPETSKQINAGVVWAPSPAFSLSVDYWNIRKDNLITALDESAALAPGAPFAGNVIRGPVDPKYPGLPGPIETVVLINANFGTLRTSGYDVGVKYKAAATRAGALTFALDGTYIATFSMPGPGGVASLVGSSDGPYAIPRWRHRASIAWDRGPWSATLAQTFQDGYRETDYGNCTGDGTCGKRRVGAYSAWDLQAAYTGVKKLKLIAGVHNLFDRESPLVYNAPNRQAWFDGSYADPRGRTFYARFEYAFK